MKLQSESKRVRVLLVILQTNMCAKALAFRPFRFQIAEYYMHSAYICMIMSCINPVYVTLSRPSSSANLLPPTWESHIEQRDTLTKEQKQTDDGYNLCFFSTKNVFSGALNNSRAESETKQAPNECRTQKKKKNTYIFVMRNAWWYWIVTSSRRADINLNNTYLFVYRRIPDTTDAKTMPLPHRFGFGLHSRDDGRTVCACIFGVQWRTYVTRPFWFEFVVVIAPSSSLNRMSK